MCHEVPVWRKAALAGLLLAAALCLQSTLAWAQEAAPAADAAPAAPADGAGNAQPLEGKSPVMWFLKSSGLIGLFILILSIYFIATVGRLFLEMRMQVAIPPELVQEVEATMEKRDFQGVYNLVAADDSFFGRALATGIKELPNGLSEARDAMERQGDALTVEMEKKISMLAVLGTLGPMIGLLGTLKGMISSFSVIALYDTQLKSSQVAEGISEALLLTFEGVALSVPAIYFFAVFRNRVSMISTNVMLEADEFLRRFFHTARQKTPGAAVAAAKTKT